MRPYFFKRPAVSEGKRAEDFREMQRQLEAARPVRMGVGRAFLLGALGILGGFFGANREVAAWLRTQDTGLPIHIIKTARDKSIEAAQAKRERRRARNLRWWANDRTWSRA